MKNKMNEKIAKVKKEHEQLMSLASEQILKNNEDVQEYSNEMLSVLEYDEKSIKKYQATVGAQNLIVSLTEQILNATTAEEIVDLRKKINYNITKIRAELKRRNVSQDVTENYNNQVSSLRKSIAVYIRFIKRGENISEIDRLSANMDNLSKEELTTLKKCLQKENRYNKRNLTAFENKEEEISKEPKTQTIASEKTAMAFDKPRVDKPLNSFAELHRKDLDDFHYMPLPPIAKPDKPLSSFARLRRKGLNDFHYMPLPPTQKNNAIKASLIDKKKQNNYALAPVSSENTNNYSIKIISEDIPYEETSEYFNESLDQFSECFDVVKTLNYSQGKFVKNTINFIRNIPRYIHNKKAIAEMERQCSAYYTGYDFISFIECMKKRNSIQKVIRFILKDSSLTASERASLGDHESCSKWMYNFCAERRAPIYERRYKIC